jgi:hypothetical protein
MNKKYFISYALWLTTQNRRKFKIYSALLSLKKEKKQE